jgi:hypothetical protein
LFGGSSCFNEAEFLGVWFRFTISGTAIAGAGRAHLSATSTAGSLDGTYEVVSGGECGTDAGSFSLARH